MGGVAAAQDDGDRVTRAEKAEAICTGSPDADNYNRWEIDPSSQMCPTDTCVIRQKKDHSVTYAYKCPTISGGDDNEAAAPVTVYESSRLPSEE